MQFVYVLTSSQNDLYYEQFFLSVYSLRLYNPDAHITLLTDKPTKDNLAGKRQHYEEYITEIKVVETPPELNRKESSRRIKTSIGNIIDDDFLFIDCDTIICNKLDTTFASDVIIGGVPDTHVPLSKHYLREVFRNDNRKLGFDSPFKSDAYFNGGILFCRRHDLSKEFFSKWNSLWNKSRLMGNSQDMPSLNQANYEMGNIIKELDGIWNCQISHNGLPFLYNAHIIHYYATSLASFTTPFLLSSDDLLLSVKNDGRISDKIKNLIHNPKSAFVYNSRILADQVIFDILESGYFSKLLWLRRKHEKLFWKLNGIVNSIKKAGYKKTG